MDSVGPGSVLAGRYHVQQRVHQGTWSSIWQALDETLDRPVSLRIVDRGHPRGSQVVDAARRAAGVEDPRLQRVLDVGVEDGLTYVVCEWVGADSLTDLVHGGVPAPDEVRRLVGEAATALEAARHRGLHHLALTPDCLLRGHDGPVTLTGLAVDAALAGTEIADPAEASRRDAVALVALIYAGLTGRWPLDPVPGLEPPPRVNAALPAPSELAAGVPADLDAMCVQALRLGEGPADPGQLATQLAPWPANPVVSPNRTAGAFPISLAGDHGPATALLPAVGDARSVQSAV
ncbi:MAG: protein kinase family protein, partial [Actinomycetota bacterium]|nr:protein kinase family protein [Actinomycetota bacterium]